LPGVCHGGRGFEPRIWLDSFAKRRQITARPDFEVDIHEVRSHWRGHSVSSDNDLLFSGGPVAGSSATPRYAVHRARSLQGRTSSGDGGAGFAQRLR